MKETDYYKSGKHTENYQKALGLAAEASVQQKRRRIEKYEAEPTLCKMCSTPHPYAKRTNKFCSSSCAAKFNNVARGPQSEETRQKRIKTMKGRPSPASRPPPPRPPNLVSHVCKICGVERSIPFYQRGLKTCGSGDCITQASVGLRTYQNGSRKPVWYFNKHDNVNVLLESSWEVAVAKALDSANISWSRPRFIKWVDSTGKTRRYFPDFYLKDSDVYLDPKNPFCMVRDAEKIAVVSKQITLVVGSLDVVLSYISTHEYGCQTRALVP